MLAYRRAEDICKWLVTQDYSDLDALNGERELCKFLDKARSILPLARNNKENRGSLKRSTQTNRKDFFGCWGHTTDYIFIDDAGMILEVKLLQSKKNYGTKYEARNGLLQTVLQAFAANADRAIFLTLDKGPTRERLWNNDEKALIDFFKTSPFCKDLAVARVRLDQVSQKPEFEVR